MAITNIDVINSAEQEGVISTELATAVRSGISDTVKNSAALTNGFVDLLNRIVMYKIHGIKTVNRWQQCFRERIMFGTSVDFLTIGRALDKDRVSLDHNAMYHAHINDDGGVDNLREKPEMQNKVRTGRLTYRRYSVTITDDWLTYAIVNQYGIDEVTDKFVSSCDKAIGIDTDTEFWDFIKHEYEVAESDEYFNPSLLRINPNTPETTYPTSKDLSFAILKLIHDAASELAYVNDTHGTQIVQSVPFEDMMLIIDYSVYNRLKIDSYSGAYNLNDLKIPVSNIIPVDMGFTYGENPTTGICTPDSQFTDRDDVNQIFAILCDKERYTIRDKLLTVKARYNEGLLTTNIFHHIDRRFFSDYSRPAYSLSYLAG